LPSGGKNYPAPEDNIIVDRIRNNNYLQVEVNFEVGAFLERYSMMYTSDLAVGSVLRPAWNAAVSPSMIHELEV